ncbi:ABC transporter ATP-binding protein [Fructilactobacillus sanfranciscensis]|uniref:ABC transporter ATP-binding protein/permease n=1 Tax=Fructilactobacillus sanfranciscensis TaxID=1625 RepID=UPI000CD492EB|nr:ABC transporter ATP-binding protein/permease [Fructilactobacillus sanfranciscensis]POH13726.1 ABC transporter ATP-binding protein [Fructilactobacillus sanfranciscensis]
MAYLQLVDIKKTYHVDNQDFKVLKGINLSFERGEFVSILGESGGGKTTLMNIIAGLDSDYSGDVLIEGKSLKHDTTKQLDEYRRSTIGFIFQSFNLISHLTVRENVLVSLEMTTLSHKQQLERTDELLDKVGLADHKNKYPNQLSGGQKQRVSIARTLASDPDIIIADEPTGALDAQNTDEILELMNDIAKDGKLVLAVTHSQIVADYGTRIVHLANGLIDDDKVLKPAFPVKDEPRPFKAKVASAKSIAVMAWHHFTYNLKRNLLITFGTSIGIFSVIIMLGLGNGVKGYINHEIYSQINPNTIQVTEKTANDDQASKVNFSKHDINSIKKIKDVKKVTNGYYAMGGGQLKDGNKSASLSFLQTFNNTIKKNTLKTGTVPGKDEILISKSDAEKLNKKHPYAMKGKTISLYVNVVGKNSQPQIVSRQVKVSGVADGQGSSISYDTLKSMFEADHLTFKPNFLAVDIAGGVQNVEPVQDSIKSIKNSQGKHNLMITGAGSIVSTLNTYVNLAVSVLTAIAAISLIVSAIMIIVVLYISVSERTKEIGILRALGFTKRNIRDLFIFESFFIGLFAAILADVIGYLIEFGINHVSESAVHYSLVQITAGNAIFGIVVSVVICLLAALAPARKAAKVDPVVSLSAE